MPISKFSLIVNLAIANGFTKVCCTEEPLNPRLFSNFRDTFPSSPSFNDIRPQDDSILVGYGKYLR